MPYIYSTLANDNVFNSYDKHPRIATPKASVLIKGKAGVQNTKTLETPLGVATKVTDEELELLKTIGEFTRMVKEGYLVIDGEALHGHDADEKAADMNKDDKSKQDTAATYEAMGKKAPKEEKGEK